MSIFTYREYQQDLVDLETSYQNTKKEILENISQLRVNMINEFINENIHMEGKTFAQFVQSMRNRQRIVVIFTDLYFVLNDDTFEYAKPLWGRGMQGFKETDTSLEWWEHTPAAYQKTYMFCCENDELIFRMHNEYKCRWFLTPEEPYKELAFCIQRIEYPIESKDSTSRHK